ncbi:MAG: hypothetical protein IT371_28840 [Deltaproteobacteria bacterium]|nr:hypothetical protein [Deltaproteobacteria bacterium]
MSGVPFAYPPEGAVMVSAEGAVVLAHDGFDGRPLWQRTLDATVVGLAASPSGVAALDESGLLSRLALSDGAPLAAKAVASSVRAFAHAARAEVAAILTEGSLLLVPGDELPRTVAQVSAFAVAVRADGSAIAVGQPDGRVQVFDAASRTLLGGCQVQAAVQSVTWSPLGHWVVAAGQQIVAVAPDGSHGELRYTARGNVVPECLAPSVDGKLLGFRAGPHLVQVLEWGRSRLVGSAVYEREVGAVAFGAGRSLGVGLDGGDADRLDLVTEEVFSTTGHPGRPTRSWTVALRVERGLLADVLPQVAPPTERVPPLASREKRGVPPTRRVLPWVLGLLVAALVGAAGLWLGILRR